MSEKIILNPFTGKLQKITDSATIEAIENNIVNLGFRVAINGDYSEFEMAGKTIDEYEDESGIDTVDSDGQRYDSDGEYYQPLDNEGGIDSFTKLMLHCNGTEGSTIFTDSSSSPKTVTANADAQIDTAQKKFGTASGLFDGTGDYLSTPDSDDFHLGSGAFTIDFWVRFSSLAGEQNIYSQRNGADFQRLNWAPNRWEFQYEAGGTSVGLSKSWTPTINTWYHVAVVRGWGGNANDFAICVDGTQIGSTTTDSDTLNNISAQFIIGVLDGTGDYFNGHIDEFRWSKGVARWTSNFTPPTGEYTVSTGFENMTLISEAHSVDSAPSTIDLVLREEDVDSITLNTDLLAYASRDDGATWEQGTLSVDNTFDANSRILKCSCNVSGQPSGTDLRYKIVTANEKDLKIHGTARLWS